MKYLLFFLALVLFISCSIGNKGQVNYGFKVDGVNDASNSEQTTTIPVSTTGTTNIGISQSKPKLKGGDNMIGEIWAWYYIALALIFGVILGTVLVRYLIFRGLLQGFSKKWSTVVAILLAYPLVWWLSGDFWWSVALLGFMSWCTAQFLYDFFYQGELNGWSKTKTRS